jgi:plastocyanin
MPAARSVLAASFLALMALAPAPASAAAAAADVIVSDNFYLPETLTVQAGSTVLWEQQGNLPHNVQADDGTWDSHPACTPTVQGTCMRDGDTFSRAFPEPGTFGYYCKVHGGPGGIGMSGVVRVVEPGFVSPTTVDDVRATKSGTSLRVLGSATFGGVASLEVGTDPTGDGAMGLPAVFGLDLTKASIGQPDPSSGDLSFMIDAADLPPSGGVPELAQYLWDFGIRQGGETAFFALLGKPTDAVNGTRVPSFYLQSCGATCTEPTDNPLEATMDGETNRIAVSVPRSLLEQLSGMEVTGAVVGKGNNYFDGAAARAIVGSNDPGPDFDRVAITGTYTVGERGIRVAIVPSGGAPVFDRTAELSDTGAFTSTIDVSGFTPGAYDVWVEACFGSNCATASTAVTL